MREGCFLWMDTPDGSKWASKNPEKAKKAMMIREKIKQCRVKSRAESQIPNKNNDNPKEGALIMEELILVSEDCQKNDNVVLD
ncbi:Bgt-20161, partial [Blumeria graminis f. sp. tritici]